MTKKTINNVNKVRADKILNILFDNDFTIKDFEDFGNSAKGESLQGVYDPSSGLMTITSEVYTLEEINNILKGFISL